MSLSRQHKQTLVILIVCILGVAIAGYSVYGNSLWRKDIKFGKGNDITALKQDTNTNISESSDWQKQFAGQNQGTIQTPPTKTTTSAPEPETLTGEFGKKFFEQYMYLKQNNQNEDPQAVQSVVSQATSDFVNSAPQPRIYEIREITSTTNSGLDAEKQYANSIGSIFSRYMIQKDAGSIAAQALENQDKSKVKEIEAIADSYKNILKEILATPTPKNLTSYQVNLLNGISSMGFVADGMTKIFSDPIQSVVAMGVYEKALGQFRNALLDIKYYFSSNGVQFSTNEPATIISLMTQ